MPATFIGHGSSITTLDLGGKLGALRERGILFLDSGNVVDTLRRIDRAGRDGTYHCSERFDAKWNGS